METKFDIKKVYEQKLAQRQKLTEEIHQLRQALRVLERNELYKK